MIEKTFAIFIRLYVNLSSYSRPWESWGCLQDKLFITVNYYYYYSFPTPRLSHIIWANYFSPCLFLLIALHVFHNAYKCTWRDIPPHSCSPQCRRTTVGSSGFAVVVLSSKWSFIIVNQHIFTSSPFLPGWQLWFELHCWRGGGRCQGTWNRD